MKKNLLSLMTILTVAIVSVGFVSCGGDDDNDNKDKDPIVNPSNPNNGGNSDEGNSDNFVFKVQTGETSDITYNSAILSGSLTTTNGQPDAIGFLIGTAADLTNTNRNRDLTIFDITSNFSATVDGLQPLTTYYYRAYAYSRGTNSYFLGDTKSFVTDGGSGNSGEASTAQGNGTLNNPYNVAGINAIASRLQAGEIDATDYYFKGMISQITNEFSSLNNNPDSTATFYISDSGGTSQFLCNHVKYLHNEGYWGGSKNINIGDEVIICGKITKGGTSTGRAYVYSMNGNTGTTDAIEYSIGGRTFRTVLVEGGPMKPFYIMQTEIPVNADIIINNRIVSMNTNPNVDNMINRVEFVAFLLIIREITGYRFRLPTKEEWQYAAQGGNKSKGYTYSGSNSINDVAWYSGNSNNKVHDVAQKQPNELGLYDMSGNYGEVCYDRDEDDRGIDGPICGGNWNDAASSCTVSSWVEEGTGRYSNGYSKARHFDGDHETVRLVYTKW